MPVSVLCTNCLPICAIAVLCVGIPENLELFASLTVENTIDSPGLIVPFKYILPMFASTAAFERLNVIAVSVYKTHLVFPHTEWMVNGARLMVVSPKFVSSMYAVDSASGRTSVMSNCGSFKAGLFIRSARALNMIVIMTKHKSKEVFLMISNLLVVNCSAK